MVSNEHRKEFLENIKDGAIEGWHKHKKLPSVTGAQAILESAWGTSDLAKKSNNIFGIKGNYQGYGYLHNTWEHVNGKDIRVDDWFRHYPDIATSVTDHGEFFTSTPWRTENYKHVIGEVDYHKATQALSDAGYATDPNYPTKLNNIIETYTLYEWDKEALEDDPEETVTYEVTEQEVVINGERYAIEEVKGEIE